MWKPARMPLLIDFQRTRTGYLFFMGVKKNVRHFMKDVRLSDSIKRLLCLFFDCKACHYQSKLLIAIFSCSRIQNTSCSWYKTHLKLECILILNNKKLFHIVHIYLWIIYRYKHLHQLLIGFGRCELARPVLLVIRLPFSAPHTFFYFRESPNVVFKLHICRGISEFCLVCRLWRVSVASWVSVCVSSINHITTVSAILVCWLWHWLSFRHDGVTKGVNCPIDTASPHRWQW